MWERLQRFSALERPARVLFIRAAAVLPLISLSLRFRGFRKTQRSLQKSLFASRSRTLPAAGDIGNLAARMVRAAVHRSVFRATCLEESLALWWLLGRQGVASELRIGVRKDHAEFEAHAWVELEGVALNQPEAMHQHYAAFDATLSPTAPGSR